MKTIYDKNLQKVPIKTWCNAPEQGALDQAIALSNHPAVFRHVALMPDTHMGVGMPIGGVVCLNDAISPNMVGVDIGCGMCAINTGLKTEEVMGKLKEIRARIAKIIPVGFEHRTDLDVVGHRLCEGLLPSYCNVSDEIWAKIGVSQDSLLTQIGTLGSGNHFIEIQKSDAGEVWIMIHSGSRNLGNRICQYFDKMAREQCNSWRVQLPSPDLAFFPASSADGITYISAMELALNFAYANRRYMMTLVKDAFICSGLSIDECALINIHHNYAQPEIHFGQNVIVHRKGATLADGSRLGIIPGSMGTSSFIVRGLNNPESFASCSHGAGRKMSRSMAKKSITMDDFNNSMVGVEFDVSSQYLDEAPGAYKDINLVMQEQADLVKIEVELKPLAVIKG